MAYGTKANLSGFAGTNTEDAQKFTTRVTLGAAGAVASQIGNSMKVTALGSSLYKAQLVSSYGKWADMSYAWKNATGVVLDVCMVTDALATDGYFTFETRAKNGTATDGASGDILAVTVWVTDSLNNAVR